LTGKRQVSERVKGWLYGSDINNMVEEKWTVVPIFLQFCVRMQLEIPQLPPFCQIETP